MEGEIKLGFGDIPKKGIFGPTREQADKLNASSGNEGKGRGKWLDKALLGATAAAGALTGATPTITRPPDAFAETPPAIETPDQRGPYPAEVQGIVIPSLPTQFPESSPTTQPETSPTAQSAKTSEVSERLGIASDFTKFTTDQEFNPEAKLKFSEEELQFIREDWDRIVKIIQEKYGSDLIDRKVIFRKVSSEFKGGFGYTNISNKEAPDGSGKYIELQVNRLNKGALWEIHHQQGHIFFTQAFLAITRNDITREEWEKEAEWLTRASEGVAEAIAYELDEPDDSLTPEQFKSRYFWQTRSYFDPYLDTELGRLRRQDPNHALTRFDHSREAYNNAATAFLDLEKQLGVSFFPNISRPYRQRSQTIFGIKERRQMEKQSTSIDLVNQELDLTKWGHQAMLDKIEATNPGFKDALSREPALYLKEAPTEVRKANFIPEGR